MPFARALPAVIASRFRNAPRLRAASGEAAFEVLVAAGFALRLRGLAGLEPGELVPLLFPRCRSLHTFGMRSPLDVVWLARDGEEAEVLEVVVEVPPRRLLSAPGSAPRAATAALELPAGEASVLGLRIAGDHLAFAAAAR